jgi:predicted ATPase
MENDDLANTYHLTIPRPEYLGGKYWNLKRLTPITIIFGKNGSGKSIPLRQIRKMNPELNH